MTPPDEAPDDAATSVARLVPQTLEGEAGAIEALLQEREAHEPEMIAIVCHPHPLYGGTMHNKVVHRVAATLFQMGAAVLRFNFRGVGKSDGRHDRGAGELVDARVALAWLAARHPQAKRWVAGFSFGSWVASRTAAAEPAVERLLMIAPGVHTQTFEEMRTMARPKIVIQGMADDICKPANLTPVFATWAEPKRLIEVPGASHFFDRKLNELGDAVGEAMRG